MPTKKQILSYWNAPELYNYDNLSLTSRLMKLGKCQPYKTIFMINRKVQNLGEFLKIEDEEFCFACGLPKPTNRCHILAVEEGGTDSIDNLHLLCKNCHSESESFSNKLYWKWFLNKDEILELDYWIKNKKWLLNDLYDKLMFMKFQNDWTFESAKERSLELFEKSF